MRGGTTSELQDLLRIAGIGLVLGLLHVFFEQTGKKEFSFFLNLQSLSSSHFQSWFVFDHSFP